jgi:hypothetical protein
LVFWKGLAMRCAASLINEASGLFALWWDR